MSDSPSSSNPLAAAQPILRIARPTDDLDAVVRFYVDGLGFSVAGSFEDHEGFDGVFLKLVAPSSSSSSCYYHLEFTRRANHRAGRAPTQDNLLVFYLPSQTLYRDAVARMRARGHEPVSSFNPYWDRCGTTFADPDGYRVVLANMESPV
ncbi:prolyl endopeptidase [Xylariaceae sp. FL0594]|nr:prolyl endopeptidase [Xylariaceae sp. FL0594]